VPKIPKVLKVSGVPKVPRALKVESVKSLMERNNEKQIT
jgi:hypothetical protein